MSILYRRPKNDEPFSRAIVKIIGVICIAIGVSTLLFQCVVMLFFGIGTLARISNRSVETTVGVMLLCISLCAIGAAMLYLARKHKSKAKTGQDPAKAAPCNPEHEGTPVTAHIRCVVPRKWLHADEKAHDDAGCVIACEDADGSLHLIPAGKRPSGRWSIGEEITISETNGRWHLHCQE